MQQKRLKPKLAAKEKETERNCRPQDCLCDNCCNAFTWLNSAVRSFQASDLSKLVEELFSHKTLYRDPPFDFITSSMSVFFSWTSKATRSLKKGCKQFVFVFSSGRNISVILMLTKQICWILLHFLVWRSYSVTALPLTILSFKALCFSANPFCLFSPGIDILLRFSLTCNLEL